AWTETARSAAAFAVTLTVEELLAALGSNSLDVTEAVFGMLPEPVGVITMVMVAEAPLVRLPSEQVIVGGLVQVPCEEATETKVATAVGGVSVTVTPVAGSGPLLVTVRV